MFNFWGLHGFLGKKTDFLSITNKNFKAIDLYDEKLPKPKEGMKKWALKFNNMIPFGNNILCGYSVGGRLALHSIIEQPSLWKAAIIISAHPGLATEKEKEERLKHDSAWANRFKTDGWDLLMKDWNNQRVFCDDIPPIRNEKDYDRLLLSETLKGWSLGTQLNLREQIKNLPIPILWITGKKDVKFTSLAENLKFEHPHSKHIALEKFSHRMNLDKVNEEIDRYLIEIF